MTVMASAAVSAGLASPRVCEGFAIESDATLISWSITRKRDIVDEAFRRRAVLDMEPHIQALGDRLADELFADGSPADLVERYARKLPLAVITELLGLPLADREKFTAWAGGFTRFKGALGLFA